ncbi:MAG: hypothetical protein JG777_1947 [Clostridia bacterium]|nr:hypothetical protein [Clostridia bacterium]
MKGNSQRQMNLLSVPAAGNKIKIILTTIIALLTIAGTALGYKMFFSKTPKQLYLEAEYRNYKVFAEKIKKLQEKERVKLVQYLLENPSHVVTELSGNISLDGNGMAAEQLDTIKDLLKKAKLVIDTKNNPKEKKSLSQISLQLNGSNLVDAHIFQSDRKLGLKVPLLYDKYFVLDTDNFKQSLENIGIQEDNIPEKILTWEDFKGVIKLPKEQLRSIGLDYGKFITSSIKEEEIVLTKNVTFKISDSEIKCKKFTLTMSEDRAKDLLAGLVSKFKDDEKLLELLTENVYNIARLMENTGNISSEELGKLTDRNEIKSVIKDGALEFKDLVANLKFPNGIKMSVLVDKQNNIVDRKIEFEIGYKEEDERILFMIFNSNLANKDQSEISELNVMIKPRGSSSKGKNELTFALNSYTVPNTKENTLKKKLEVYTKLYNNDREVLNGKSEININNQKDEQGEERIETDLVVTAKGEQDSGSYDIKLNGQILQDLKGTLKDKLFDADSDMKFKVDVNDSSIGNQALELKLKVKENIKLDETPDFPELGSSNSIDLINVNEAEKMEIIQEIQMQAFKFYMKNSQLFNLN